MKVLNVYQVSFGLFRHSGIFNDNDNDIFIILTGIYIVELH